MIKFIRNIVLFLLPILLLLFAPPLIFLYDNKECFYDYEKIIQTGESYLFGMYYKENNINYLKWYNISHKQQKKIWALGNSRALQFREFMFKHSFYNAGYTVFGINDLKQFMCCIDKDKYPNYILLNLDFNWFNKNSDDLSYLKAIDFWEKSKDITPTIVDLKNVWFDYLFKNKSQISNSLSGKTKIGINANYNCSGIRNDGSMYYGKQISKLLLGGEKVRNDIFNNTFERIEEGNGGFEYGCKGGGYNTEAINKLNEFLKFCKQNDILVVGFFMPYPNVVYEKISESNKYTFIPSLSVELSNLFANFGFEFCDVMNIFEISNREDEFLDGFHPSEVSVARVLINSYDKSVVLKDICEKSVLTKLVENRTNRYLLK